MKHMTIRPTRLRLRPLRSLIAVGLALSLGLALSGCSDSGSTQGGSTSSELKVAIASDVVGFDPYSKVLQQYVFSKVIYEPLFEYDSNLKPQPVLAKSWNIAKDSKSVKLQLRKGVKFHDGAAFNADAVVKNFERAKNPETGQNIAPLVAPVASVIPNGDAVTINFTSAVPDKLIYDMLQGFPMVDPAAFNKLKDSASGTGPFKLAKWAPGTSIELSANKSWWKETPKLKALTFKIFSDANAEVSALQSGDVDMIDGVGTDQAKNLKSSGFRIVPGPPGALTMEMRLNPKSGPLVDKSYRQALMRALDRKSIVDSVLDGYGKPIETPFFTHFSDTQLAALDEKYGYSEDAAKAAFGLSPDGFTIMLQSSQPATIAAAQIVQASLKKIGVNVKLEKLEPTTFSDRLLTGKFDSTISIGSGGQHYPSNIAFGSAWRLEGNALWGNDVPKNYANALGEMQRALTLETQSETLNKFSDVVLDMAAVLQISDNPVLFAVSDKVKGFDLTVDGMPLFGGVSVS